MPCRLERGRRAGATAPAMASAAARSVGGQGPAAAVAIGGVDLLEHIMGRQAPLASVPAASGLCLARDNVTDGDVGTGRLLPRRLRGDPRGGNDQITTPLKPNRCQSRGDRRHDTAAGRPQQRRGIGFPATPRGARRASDRPSRLPGVEPVRAEMNIRARRRGTASIRTGRALLIGERTLDLDGRPTTEARRLGKASTTRRPLDPADDFVRGSRPRASPEGRSADEAAPSRWRNGFSLLPILGKAN